MHFIVVTSQTCPWCDKVKALISDRGHTYKEIDIAPVKEFMLANNLKTVPQVFINGERIGGYEDVKRYLEVSDGW
jgi:glutaredoxin